MFQRIAPRHPVLMLIGPESHGSWIALQNICNVDHQLRLHAEMQQEHYNCRTNARRHRRLVGSGSNECRSTRCKMHYVQMGYRFYRAAHWGRLSVGLAKRVCELG